MTEREREILSLILNNPMISQNEIADLLGISRSGVAAHIFNLTKKGYIEGRGYIIKESDFVSIIGGINMDILGISLDSLILNNSNPGKISFALGGAGRNISLGLTKLNVPNYFISVHGDDLNGDKFKQDSQKNGMNIQYVKELPNERTSTYLYIDDQKGNRAVGIDDMDIYEKINSEFLKDKIDIINNSRYCIIDTNLTTEAIDWIYEHCKVPIFVKTVSENKNYKLLSQLNKVNTLITTPNELKGIIRVLTDSELSLNKSLDLLLNNGVGNILVYSPDDGLYFKNNEELFHIHKKSDKAINKTGASASLTSALVWALTKNFTWKDSLHYAYAAAAISIESPFPISEDLSTDTLVTTHTLLFG
ncbi:PfkB family carbohydrate kinase [Vagococcus intermedius]|uniref:PfkB family carbohydrate kinase n=1 Tax=Vagococcus intermedius TaxID=2991418 RepID=A0AAF0CTC0_9ENTE|nr:PfkB family carbohydrate kinase [Vagococcus intermedius]WEG72575.1 PfkB family carbohydrate kinase [Vagococcus intermedius]WEG74661.1 PfkB family carbohydrate kinase [Vagococcus intermedius]